MVEVRPGLLLGSMDDVFVHVDRPRRRHQRVTHLLSLLNTPLDWSDIETPQGAPLAMLVCVPDMPAADLLRHFEPCVSFIAEGRETGSILVHCQYGISRSATVVLAYLMKSEKLSFTEALEQLREKKPDVRPNSGFVEQLRLWETMKCRIDTCCKAYKAYVLRHQAVQMKEAGYVDSLCMSPDPSHHQVHKQPDSPVSYQCRKCRRLLFTSENVIQHELGEGEADFKWHRQSKQQPTSYIHTPSDCSGHSSEQFATSTIANVRPLSETGTTPTKSDNDSTSPSGTGASLVPHTPTEQARMRATLAGMMSRELNVKDRFVDCSSVFIEPIEWIGPSLLGSNEGKLLCPKCGSRLGSFNWAGAQCSCGRWVTPSFQVHKNKLDIT